MRDSLFAVRGGGERGGGGGKSPGKYCPILSSRRAGRHGEKRKDCNLIQKTKPFDAVNIGAWGGGRSGGSLESKARVRCFRVEVYTLSKGRGGVP